MVKTLNGDGAQLNYFNLSDATRFYLSRQVLPLTGLISKWFAHSQSSPCTIVSYALKPIWDLTYDWNWKRYRCLPDMIELLRNY